jgi:histidyl-tRNA synthetase
VSDGTQGARPIAAVRGTKDILPAEARLWQRVEAAVKSHFELYGYREIRAPVFEATELFVKGTGETSDIVIKEMYTFTDKGGRSLTLRPEYTPSVVRAVIEHRLYLQPDPLRFYFIGPMFRYDKPQKGRWRQFHQADIEVFGESDPAVDAEVVEMADALLARLRVEGLRTLVNSVGCPKCRPAYVRELRASAEARRAELCEECRRKIDANPLRIFDCKVESCREIAETFPKITDHLCPECAGHFRAFRGYLDGYGISYEVEPRLVRGIDYYTKTTFEVVTGHAGQQNAVLGGGRYDNLVKQFGGPDLTAIGFALGMERLLSIVHLEGVPEKFLFLAYLGEEAKKRALVLARFFRGRGVDCLLEFKDRGLKAQLGRASKLGATWALIVGQDEVRRGRYGLKDLGTGRQVEGGEEELLRSIQSGR